ncbi:DMT family transporter [Paenibacillus sp. DCT19]|uniref:DMT family transporter n=1 Tax=Paenibacillus sp. DCT19 TaxID=2211212 RepID=UPI000FE26E6A|nr:EamA family transporter [Paenibacillus sp. DCT19]
MKTGRYTLLIIITTFIMGTSFPVGKIGMHYAPPFLLMGLRYILASIIMVYIVRKRPLPVGCRQWFQVALIGLFQSAGVMGCAYYSMNWITSGESAILTFTNPLLVILFSAVLYGVSYRLSQWAGVLLGFIGVVLTFGLQLSVSPGTWIGLAGSFCFAVSTLLIKRWGAAQDTFVLTAYQMLAGGIALLILSAWTEEPHFVLNVTSVFVLLWLALICSIIQFSLWFYLLQHSDPAKTSSFLFLAPFFGVLSSWILLSERMAWMMGVGGSFICIGIYLVNRRQRMIQLSTTNS